MKNANVKFTFFLISTLFLVSGCAPLISSLTAPVPQEYSTDEVKLIGAGMGLQQQSSTFRQAGYTLDSGHRLLIRFVSLKDHLNSVRASDGPISMMSLQVAVVSDMDAQTAHQALQACPIVTNWMMMATWEDTFPWGGGSHWNTPGGDYDSEGCVSPVSVQGQRITFDVSRWFLDYPRGRNLNYGLILLANQPVRLQGDTSGTYSPRLSWQE